MPFYKVIFNEVTRLFDVDTTYIEPNHYKFQTMMQGVHTYESYRLGDGENHSVRFKPNSSLKIGPYVGWNMLFLAWSLDVSYVKDNNDRKELDVSLYTQPLGVDIFWRESGRSYHIEEVRLGKDIYSPPLNGAPFGGITSSVKGLNAYYIFNNNRFSYPAAFNQSTQQKISAGSPLAGFGYTHHRLNINWHELNDVIIDKTGQDKAELFPDGLTEKVVYTDISLSGGYGYNWVFARNMLFASSLSLGLSYKHSAADTNNVFDTIVDGFNFDEFSFSNLNIDAVGRFGIVWNNGRWFAGGSTIFHSYHYSKSQFYTNNIFGSLNVYAGFNFGVKKQYRKKNKKFKL